MTALDLLYTETLLEDPRRAYELDAERFVEVVLRVLLEPAQRDALLATLVARHPALPAEPDDALAERVAREGLLALEPELLLEALGEPARFAGLCAGLARETSADTVAPAEETETAPADPLAALSAPTNGTDTAVAASGSRHVFDGILGSRDNLELLGFAALDRDLAQKRGASEASPAAAETDDGGTGDDDDAPSVLRSAQDMVHARDPDSVLFNLSTLDRVKADRSPLESGQMAMTGSGLLDIKSIAAGRRVVDDEGGGRRDVWSAAALPVPMTLGTRRKNTWLIVGVAAAAAVVLGLVAVVVLFLAREDQPRQAQVAAAEPEEEPIETPELGGALGGSGGARIVAQNTAATDDAAAAAAGEPEDGAGEPEDGAGSPETPPADGGAPTGDAGADAATPPTETAAASESKDTRDSKDDRAASSSSRDSKRDDKKDAEPKKDPAPKKDDKKSGKGSGLSKSDVQATIRANFGKIRTCSRDAEVTGKLLVKFGIKGDGRVASASIASSEFSGTKVGACVVKVVEGMKFPAHGGDTVDVTFPFHIN